MNTVQDLINYLYEDKSSDVKDYIKEQVVKTADNNKGFFWEKVLEKAMPHTKLLGGNTAHFDFTDGSDAKIGTFYSRKGSNTGKKEVSIGIKNKTGILRVCLVVPGQSYHRVFFLKIPPDAYDPYLNGSSAIKFGLSPRGTPTGKLANFRCSWKEVISP